jgi:hypothetical protein
VHPSNSRLLTGIVSDLIELRKTIKQNQSNITTTTVSIIPRSKENVKHLRARRLSGSRDHPPGIPLNGNGIRYEDQQRDDLFKTYDSISIDFESEEGMKLIVSFAMLIV